MRVGLFFCRLEKLEGLFFVVDEFEDTVKAGYIEDAFC